VPASRILVIKHGALGDIIQGIDAYAKLRAGHPGAYIAVLTTPPFAGLFAAMPWFDDVITDHRAVVVNLLQMMRMRRIMRQSWDMVIDLQCSGRTARYHQFLTPQNLRWFGNAAGASDPYPDFAGVNNTSRMDIAAGLAGGDASASADLDWLTNVDLPPGIVSDDLQNALVLVPGCSPAKPSKRWPGAAFASLAVLAHQHGHRLFIVGTSADRDAADAVLQGAPDCTDLVGKTDLPQLAALFARCGYVIGNDTGPVFLAARTGTPTLMVMGSDTDPAMSAPAGARAGWVRAAPISDVTPAQAFAALLKL
jgi:ADP-heptose:LPS heptosyltransferase